MSASHRVRVGLIAGLATVAVVGLVACGTETLDEGDAEAFVTEQLEAGSDNDTEVGSVDCPSDVEVEADTTFECTAESVDGTATATVTVRQVDDEGNVEMVDVQADVDDAAPEAADQWTGTFDSTFGELTFTADGNEVTGTYEHCDGQLTGTADGLALDGEWEENPEACPAGEQSAPEEKYSGTFEFSIAADGQSFTGTWTYADGSKDAGGDTWEGTRISDAP